MLRNILLIALIFLSQPAFAASILMDFEDGLLPSSHGWVNNARDISGVHTIINGSVPGGSGNYVLNSSGRDAFGWILDLDGIVSLNEDWVFSIDIQRVSSINHGGGGINDIGISRIADGNGGVVHIGAITDTLWHKLVLEFDQSEGVIKSYVDGVLISSKPPLDNASNSLTVLLPDGITNAISFAFGNVNVTKTVNFDNISFSSFSNNSPIADTTGSDASVTIIGQEVFLKGEQSFDPDGDDITYCWTITPAPTSIIPQSNDPGCNADVANPVFLVDAHTDYDVTLVVIDQNNAVSNPSLTVVSFENLPPKAEITTDKTSVFVGETVNLSGANSSDPNLDEIASYLWGFCSAGNVGMFDSPSSVETSFTADQAGIYTIILVVGDGVVDSDSNPNSITCDNYDPNLPPSHIVEIVAITFHDAIVQVLQNAANTINAFNSDVFKNGKMKNALTNKIGSALVKVNQELYQEALDKLTNDILAKTDGCSNSDPDNRTPDKNDWITNCSTQGQDDVYPLILDAITYLGELLN